MYVNRFCCCELYQWNGSSGWSPCSQRRDQELERCEPPMCTALKVRFVTLFLFFNTRMHGIWYMRPHHLLIFFDGVALSFALIWLVRRKRSFSIFNNGFMASLFQLLSISRGTFFTKGPWHISTRYLLVLLVLLVLEVESALELH